MEVARCVAKSAFETRSIGLGVQSCNVGSSLGLVKSQSKSSARTAWHSAGTAWHSAGGTGQHTKSQVDTIRALSAGAQDQDFWGVAPPSGHVVSLDRGLVGLAHSSDIAL